MTQECYRGGMVGVEVGVGVLKFGLSESESESEVMAICQEKAIN